MSNWTLEDMVWQGCRSIDASPDMIDTLLAELARLRENEARYRWVANELLACDYGANERGSIGWAVYGWRCYSYGLPMPKIYGENIDAAIDAVMLAEKDKP